MARYKVSGVMKIISIKANEVANVLLVAKNKEIPIKNSTADKMMPPNKGREPGSHSECGQIILDLILEPQWINCLYKSGKDERCRQKKATRIRHYLLNDM